MTGAGLVLTALLLSQNMQLDTEKLDTPKSAVVKLNDPSPGDGCWLEAHQCMDTANKLKRGEEAERQLEAAPSALLVGAGGVVLGVLLGGILMRYIDTHHK